MEGAPATVNAAVERAVWSACVTAGMAARLSGLTSPTISI